MQINSISQQLPDIVDIEQDSSAIYQDYLAAESAYNTDHGVIPSDIASKLASDIAQFENDAKTLSSDQHQQAQDFLAQNGGILDEARDYTFGGENFATIGEDFASDPAKAASDIQAYFSAGNTPSELKFFEDVFNQLHKMPQPT